MWQGCQGWGRGVRCSPLASVTVDAGMPGASSCAPGLPSVVRGAQRHMCGSASASEALLSQALQEGWQVAGAMATLHPTAPHAPFIPWVPAVACPPLPGSPGKAGASELLGGCWWWAPHCADHGPWKLTPGLFSCSRCLQESLLSPSLQHVPALLHPEAVHRLIPLC